MVMFHVNLQGCILCAFFFGRGAFFYVRFGIGRLLAKARGEGWGLLAKRGRSDSMQGYIRTYEFTTNSNNDSQEVRIKGQDQWSVTYLQIWYVGVITH